MTDATAAAGASVLVSDDRGIRTLTLNRPAKRTLRGQPAGVELTGGAVRDGIPAGAEA